MRIALAIGLALTLAGCRDTYTSSFRSMTEVRASGLVEGGWMPPELPADATDIRVKWNVDTNLSEGSYSAASPVRPGSKCEPFAADALRCGRFVFRTVGGRHYFSNRGRTP